MGHQKAAFEILTQLFTAQTILQTSTSRLILAWYMRLDLLVASLALVKPRLPRHWVEANASYCQARAAAEPDSVEWMCEVTEAQLCLISFDMCELVGRRKAGEVSEPEFGAAHQQITASLRAWRDTLHPALTDAAYLVVAAAPNNNSELFSYFVAPAQPVPLYREPLSFTTAILCWWHSMVLMHLCQATQAAAGAVQADAVAQLGDTAQHAAAVCEIIEAAARWPLRSNGLLMMLHPALGMAALFLPRSTRHHRWLREQFAWLESCG